MSSTPPTSSGKDPPRGLWQFTLAGLLRLMLAACVLAAVIGGLVRTGMANGPAAGLSFMLLAVAAPLGLMIVLSVTKVIEEWLHGRRRP